MHRIAVVSLVAALTTLGGAGSAQADTPRCVSRHEYARVVKGMTMTKVHRIFDTEGGETGLGAPPNHTRYYTPCRVSGQVEVVYNAHDKVVSKGSMLYG